MPNKLANEKSPYLLQHADNPVDWYPWGEEAFEKARAEDKPVFLSIGYATCHWCHVMAHESFEDEQVAKLMNRAFVNIKVDREERPDIDNTYMTICQMLTGQGGWPLTIIMTPDKKPFFAATYIPKRSLQSRIGMTDLVPQIERAWQNRRSEINDSVAKIQTNFSKTLHISNGGEQLKDEILQNAFQELHNRYDEQFGGFGSSPKFPSPHTLIFLMHHHQTSGNEPALKMAIHTLEQMRLGGIFDHVGGGFHRYSTDRKWLLPHFEKMLYDQAMLIMAYTLGWQHTKNSLFKETVYSIVSYLEKQLLSENGAFYSAEDADSEGEEGKFYVWTAKEIEEVLPQEEADLFKTLFNISEEGNFHDEATGRKTGRNIPHLSEDISDGDLDKISGMLTKLEQTREKRIRPLLDDKILTDWNGLMIAALSRAGAAFQDPELTKLAEDACSFIRQEMLTGNNTILHRYKDGDAGIDGMADDYAFSIWGLIELYQSTFKIEYLEEALKLKVTFEEAFRDSKQGGYFFTHTESEELLGRQKEIYDGAIPSSNSVQMMNNLRLARLTGNTSLERKASQDINRFAAQINHTPSGYTHALQSLYLTEGHSYEIILAQKTADKNTESFLNKIRQKPLVEPAVHLKTDGNGKTLSGIAPYTSDYSAEEEPSVYICKNFTCDLPVRKLSELDKKLDREA